MGCPCDGYDCDLPDKKAILMLYNSGSSSKPSVLIQPNGKLPYQQAQMAGSKNLFQIKIISGGTVDGFEFQMDGDTEVYYSCSATLNGDLYVFGGYNRRKQVFSTIYSKVQNQSLGFKSSWLWIETNR